MGCVLGRGRGTTHAGRKEGHAQGAGQGFGGQSRSQGFAGQAQPRSQERSFGNANRGNSSAPRRNGDRPSFSLGRGHNSGNK